MTPEQIDILAGIQALARAASRQTGCRVIHQVRSDISRSTGEAYDISEVRILNSDLEVLHKTTVQISNDGDDSTPELLYIPDPIDYGERTLVQQRDELAEFIANNRKQEVA